MTTPIRAVIGFLCNYRVCRTVHTGKRVVCKSWPTAREYMQEFFEVLYNGDCNSLVKYIERSVLVKSDKPYRYNVRLLRSYKNEYGYTISFMYFKAGGKNVKK